MLEQYWQDGNSMQQGMMMPNVHSLRSYSGPRTDLVGDSPLHSAGGNCPPSNNDASIGGTSGAGDNNQGQHQPYQQLVPCMVMPVGDHPMSPAHGMVPRHQAYHVASPMQQMPVGSGSPMMSPSWPQNAEEVYSD